MAFYISELFRIVNIFKVPFIFNTIVYLNTLIFIHIILSIIIKNRFNLIFKFLDILLFFLIPLCIQIFFVGYFFSAIYSNEILIILIVLIFLEVIVFSFSYIFYKIANRITSFKIIFLISLSVYVLIIVFSPKHSGFFDHYQIDKSFECSCIGFQFKLPMGFEGETKSSCYGLPYMCRNLDGSFLTD